MKKKIIVLYALICTILLTGCQCRHEWSEATCATAKTCIKCGETEGQPSDHTPGEWLESNNILFAEQHLEQVCALCDTVLETKDQQITSFSEDNLFLFSPKEFLDRLEYYAKEYFPNFHYELHSPEVDTTQETLYAYLYLDANSSQQYGLSFFNADSQNFKMNELQDTGVWCICLEKVSVIDASTKSELINSDLALALYLTCDPIWSEDDTTLQNMMHLVTYMNWIDFGEQAGYNEVNGLLYEFAYAILEVQEQYIEFQAIQVYADNWLRNR